jgi:hypothetical protein
MNSVMFFAAFHFSLVTWGDKKAAEAAQEPDA